MRQKAAKVSGIYTVTNLVNGKIYLGKSNDLNHRKEEHYRLLRRGVHKNSYIQSSWNIYGEENFLYEILEYHDEKYLPSMEHWWATMLNVHNSEYGYNLMPTHPYKTYLWSKEMLLKREATRKKNAEERGYYNSPEAREKMSKSAMGKVISEHQRELARIANTGRKRTPESIEKTASKIRGRKRGNKNSPEILKRIADKLRGRKRTPDQIAKQVDKTRVAVVQLSPDGTLIKEWYSISEARREGEFQSASIIDCCKGRCSLHKGYRFMYKKEYDKLTN